MWGLLRRTQSLERASERTQLYQVHRRASSREEEGDKTKRLCYPSLTANWQVDKQCGAKKCGERRLPYTCTSALQYAKKIDSSSSDLVLFGSANLNPDGIPPFSWGVKERIILPLVSTVAKKPINIGSVKMQLYGKGAFALGKKFKDGKLLVETFSRFNNLNVLVNRERKIRTSSEAHSQIEFYFWREGGVFSNNDANVIFSSEVRFEDNTNDGWQSGCYDKAFAESFKTGLRRGGDLKGNQREALSDFPNRNNSSKAPTRSP